MRPRTGPAVALARGPLLASLTALWLSCAAAADVRLYVFDCGSLQIAEVAAFGLEEDDTPVRELFVPCYLIEHGTGDTTRRLLFDAGLPLELAGADQTELEPGMNASYARSLEAQLTELKLTPADIDYVAFSHLHFDHVGSAALFDSAEQLIQQPEYQAGFVDALPIYETSLFAPLADSPRRLLNGDFDVFGDDSVRLLSAPGHTPGHQALLIRLEETGPLILSGDLYHFRASRGLRAVPVFNTDAAATRASMDRIEALLQAEGATLWIEHDQALADTLRKAPLFYR
ncbi:MAG: N-acyl homoserine lactonase family protein [Pseudomonadales bacterium]